MSAVLPAAYKTCDPSVSDDEILRQVFASDHEQDEQELSPSSGDDKADMDTQEDVDPSVSDDEILRQVFASDHEQDEQELSPSSGDDKADMDTQEDPKNDNTGGDRSREKAKSSSSSSSRRAAVSPQKLYACPYPECGKFYTRIYTLNKHLPTHGTRKHVCEECGKKFSLKQYLKEHKLTHTGERPYKCTYAGCTRTFRQRGKLSIHKKEHLNEDEMAARHERITRRNASLQLKEFNKNIILHRGEVDVENFLHSRFDGFVSQGILPVPGVLIPEFHPTSLAADTKTGSYYLVKQALFATASIF
eukprot:CAMPEP_0115019300 /NCGR_PEP_ID=MMETSP0216-20121206/29356_1 /TAXON_ID=223996 /ORGANISM="Protocruzia adherens, Strain Boccale" /LENGTH=303 /DNA_ID=CAMNT_0002390733 /DNA_START=105 /DNA_END=1017 /DNA_ORIENTATION=+